MPAPRIPRQLCASLALDSAICELPALDRMITTVDVPIWADVQAPVVVAMQRRGRFVV
jgi:hypothetical protein